MKLKDLYNSTKVIKSSSLEEMAADVESEALIEQVGKDESRFYPNIDFSDPSQFAIYGSAEKYYSDAFLRIRTLYPYDGSEAEKVQWINESTFIDKYIFDHKYPRFNGYANLGYPAWGTLSGTLIDGYGRSNTNTFIKTFGGPNKSDLSGLEKQFGDANKLDSTKSRESNLKFKLEEGVTIEMWVKKPAFDTSKTQKEVLFDLWNGEASSSAQYGRLRLELTGASAGSPFLFTALSGTSGVQNQSCGQNVTTSSIEDWTHIALSLKNSGSDLAASFYVNGQLNQEQSVSNAALGNVTGSIVSYIGALQTAPSGSPTIQEGAGKFSGSLDEFRYWKKERTAKEIGRNYWNSIGGGTNSDEANTNLGVYYKFNEGIVGDSSYDSVVLDYSGRVSNGTWTGYQSGARSTESAMVLAGVLDEEYKDPTIRSSHPDYVSTLSELESSGSHYDMYNNSSIFHTMPQWILEDDDAKDGNLRNLSQIIASYFDNMHIHIKEINHLKDVYSHFQTKVSDENNNTSTSGSVKPLPFADRLLTNANFVAPELFSDATVLEKIAKRSEDENYEMKLNDIKNQIYQNVYSGLINTFKEKGTNKAFRNILHAFGIDEEVIKINFYGDNVQFELKDRHSIRSVKEKFVDFNNPDRFSATVYQVSSGSNPSYITGSTSDFEKFIPITFETQVILPNKLAWDEPGGFATPFTKSVIAGMHQATDSSDYTIASPDNCDIQMYIERDEKESKRVKFHLSSSALGVHLSSSLYENMYNNNEWLFSFKLVNDKHPTANLVSSSDDGDYKLHFVGYNTIDSTEINSFQLSSSVAAADAQSFLTNSKRIYAGAKRQNFTGSLEERSDIKLGFVRFWYNELSNDTLLKHSYDSRNYGAESPFRSAYLSQIDANSPKVPEIDTLLLNWNFDTLSATDSNGEAVILDATSGSAAARYSTDFEAVKNKFYFGKLEHMPSSDEKAIDVEYVTAARSTYPEILQGDDMIEIRTQDDNAFTKETLPQNFFIAFEKSMAQTVSQEMINFMSSVTDFNNLIGRPVDKYRMEYKALAKLRQLFFERVSNEPDLDKYIDYYKWLDDALGEMLVALVPASLKHSDGINNVIENYVFSRDKYTNKFPTLEFRVPNPEGGMNTINRHLYPWKQGHAPVGGTPENENCFWWLERAERDESPLSGSDAGNNNTRVKVFQARNSVLNRSYTTPQRFSVERTAPIHGGVNYEPNKKRGRVWAATKEISESPLTYNQFGGFPLRYILTNHNMIQSIKDCNDERPVTEKLKMAFGAIDGFEAFQHTQGGSKDGLYKGGMLMPFNIMSSSVNSGYTTQFNSIPGLTQSIDIVNVHSDTTDETNEIPMQSPFTERWVGGHQHRHAPLNDGNDTEATRGEGYKILINNILNESGSIGVVGADYPYPYANQTDAPFFRKDQAKARYYRDGRAKRPVNLSNIETTGSQVGNFNKRYQFVHTFGRNQNKTFIRDIGTDVNLHNPTNTSLPQTNLDTSLVGRGAGNGNLASNFNTSSLYLAGVKESNSPLSGAVARDTVIANKFSAPGGFETMSEVFLDIYGKEKSAYNALPFRNLMVRGSGSGEEGSLLHLEDIHGNRYGLRTHLTRHASWGGVDSVIGNNKPSFHKVNRNPKWDAAEEAKDYDNYWIQHQIPQSDFQYKWVKASHTASLATSSLSKHILTGYTEPSGTVSVSPYKDFDHAVVSQSAINQRIEGATAYGYPSWDQIRNNDKHVNIDLKKSYGYSVENNGTPEVLEESRVTANIPNYAVMKFKGESFRFVYPYVNMKYHFDNEGFEDRGVRTLDNETIYDNLVGYYQNEDHNDFAMQRIVIRQNLYPDFRKHTKYDVRHRHYFVSKFWTDGENLLYNTDIGPESYHRLDEIGRRQQNVTASLFSLESLSSQTRDFLDSNQLTNIIPSQSIWSMDSRTEFTSSNAQVAASNSAGAPGVLQNQDHHFHNGVSELLVPGQAATGSFRTKGATVFGTPSSGSFRVQGMVPTGIKATGSFEVTGATVFGEPSISQFYASGAYVAGASASMTFDVTGATTLGEYATASFRMKGQRQLGTYTTGTFSIGNYYQAPIRATGTFDAIRIPRYGDRGAAAFVLKDPSTLYDGGTTKYDGTGITIEGISYKLDVTGGKTDSNTVKYVTVYEPRSSVAMESNSYAQGSSFSGFTTTTTNGITIDFEIKLDQWNANNNLRNPKTADTYRLLEVKTSGGLTAVSIYIVRNSITGTWIRCRRHYGVSGAGSSVYDEITAPIFGTSDTDKKAGDGNWHKIRVQHLGTAGGAGWLIYVDGNSQSSISTNTSTVTNGSHIPAYLNGYYYLGDSDTDIEFYLDEIAIYDWTQASTTQGNSSGIPGSSTAYNNGKWFDRSGAANLVAWWTLGSETNSNTQQDSYSNFYDIAGNNDFSVVNGSTNVTFEDRGGTYSSISTNLRTSGSLADKFVDTISAYITASSAARAISGDIPITVTSNGIGPSNDINASLVTVSYGNAAQNAFASYNISEALFDAVDATQDIKSGDEIDINGRSFQIRHASAIDPGDIYTFSGSTTSFDDALIYQSEDSRAWRWNSTTTYNRLDIYNQNYSGFDNSGDMTISFWIQMNDTNDNTTRWIASFWNDSGTTSPQTPCITIRAGSDDMSIFLGQSGSANYRRYNVPDIFEERYQLVTIVLDRGSIQTTPIVYVDEDAVSVNPASSDPGTGTGFNRRINSVFIGDYPTTNTGYELNAALASMSVWRGKLTQDEVKEIYNKGRYKELITHSRFVDGSAIACNDWWKFNGYADDDDIEDLALPASQATLFNDERTLAFAAGSLALNAVVVPAYPYTFSSNGLQRVAGDFEFTVKYTYGIAKEFINASKQTLEISNSEYWNNIVSVMEANGYINNVSYSDQTTEADFTVVTNDVQNNIQIAINQSGDTFNDASSTTNAFAGSGFGLGGVDAEIFVTLRFRKENASGQVYNVQGSLDNNDYVNIAFNINGTTSTTTSQAYSTNPVHIDVTQFGSDAALWSKIEQAIDNHNLISGSASRSSGNFTVHSTNPAKGKTHFIKTSNTSYIATPSNTGGDLPSGGSVHGHTLDIGSYTITLTTSSSDNTSQRRIDITDSSANIWNQMETIINNNTYMPRWTVDSRNNIDSDTEEFVIVARNRAESDNGTVESSDSSFNVTDSGSNGADDTGAEEDDRLKLPSGSGDYRYLYIKFDNNDTDAASTKYVNSLSESIQNNSDFWDMIQAKLESSPWNYSASYDDNGDGTARFTVESDEPGTDGNKTGAHGNSPTFTNVTQFSNGVDEEGIRPGDNILVYNPNYQGGDYRIFVSNESSNSGLNFNVLSSSTRHDDDVWEDLRSKIQSYSGHITNTGSISDGMMLFSITSSLTGTTVEANPDVQTGSSNSGLSYNITDAGSGGVDETGARAGDTITIDGVTFTLVSTNGNAGAGQVKCSNVYSYPTVVENSVSDEDFWNDLTASIEASSSFTTASYNGSGDTRTFSLTASATGTVYNDPFTRSSNNRTFSNLRGAAGGTDTFGLQDTEYIRFWDTDDVGALNYLEFQIDTESSTPETQTQNYQWLIGIQDIKDPSDSQTDAERSRTAWNRISASIKARSPFGHIAIEEFIDDNGGSDGEHHAIFHITSSNTGSRYNNDIKAVSNVSPRDGFSAEPYVDGEIGSGAITIDGDTRGGTNQSGATPGDTITIDGVTFTLVSGTAGAGEVQCASEYSYPDNVTNELSDNDYFNNLTAAIEASTSLDPVSWAVYNNNSASFELTSSVTGTVDNSPITETGYTFTNLSGMSGGYDPVWLRFKEIIPQPRYNYPHALTSPGSLRAPSAKSNLGLISADYKLRSNHFNLKRSLGYATDGLYDNTSRWTTPDLSGLTPMDDDYNTWYENIRGHNKHFSLVPEFRISSHVKDLTRAGSNELDYFKKNFYLEITGTSMDNGATVAKNTINISGNDFMKEYSLSSNIKNMENFLSDNSGETEIARITLSCDAIMSFLPYEGFYPQTRTVQMCEAFADSYAKHFTAEEADEDDSNLLFPDNNVFVQTRPIFDAVMSPGLLYNTIKSGMAVDYPLITSKMATASLQSPYGGDNYMINNEYFDDRLPFETLINPESYLKDKKIVDANPHPSSSVNLRTKWNGLGDFNYRLMANNFFAESIEFFLEGGKTSRIISKPDTDPNFGVVVANHAGQLPTYRSIFKVYKSKKQHPWVEFKGASEVVKNLAADGVHYYVDSNKVDKYFYRPPSGTNYFLDEFAGLTGSDLEYDMEKIGYPRPQMNPYAEVETITMYSQPNAFGPPCAGGVAVEFGSIENGVETGTGDNNTTYMMYDSTNGYNAPFTPPYYDGEAWAIYTFTPERAGKHTLDEILQNTTVEFLRYELNHEKGAFGDRGTFGPQGFSINDNAMQIDATFNLFKKVSVHPVKYSSPGVISEIDTNPEFAGKAWVIESKYETPILDFSKYLNRDYNAVFEKDVSTSDIYTSQMSLSGTRSEPDVLSTQHASLASVHELSGILNPIGMWHQYGEFPEDDDKGIFMQMIDVPDDYTILGTEMPIANPKYVVVKPEINDCDASALDNLYNTGSNAAKGIKPYFKQQENRRKLVGKDTTAVVGSAIQVLNKEDGVILDTEIKESDLIAVYGSVAPPTERNDTGGIFKIYKGYQIIDITGSSLFTGSDYFVYVDGVDSSASYPQLSNGEYQGQWAAGYYNYDRRQNYQPIAIETKDYASLSYDLGVFSRGVFEEFLKEFSIGIKYSDQSADFSDMPDISCVALDVDDASTKKIVPTIISDVLAKDVPSISNLAKVDISEPERKDLLGIPKKIVGKKVDTHKSVIGSRIPKRWRLIPDRPSVETTADNSNYSYYEPQFVRGSIRYDAGYQENDGSTVDYENKLQMAPQNDKNFARNASTIRWGQFMHNNDSPRMIQSLADLVGFSQEKVKMGVTAETKTIREAVIAIPYIAIEDSQREFLTLDKFEVDRYLYQNNFITEDRNARNPENRIRTESNLGESVKVQIDKMMKYNIPPHLDFIKYDVEPVPMYIFEFEKELDREDLNGIWQGVRTENLKKIEFKTTKVAHDFNVNELLGALGETEEGISAIKDIKWTIFKVKQKAAINYDKKMSDDLSDGSYRFHQQNLKDELLGVQYGYNWPYDYFSMVENAKVSINVQMRSINEQEEAESSDVTAGYKETPSVVEEAVPGFTLGTIVPSQEDTSRFNDVVEVDKSIFEDTPTIVGGATYRFIPESSADETPRRYNPIPKVVGGRRFNIQPEVNTDGDEPNEVEGDGENVLGGSGNNEGDGIDGRY